MIHLVGVSPSTADSIRARYERLTVALELFPHCIACGTDLSEERLTRLVYVVDRNRFKCAHCPTVAS